MSYGVSTILTVLGAVLAIVVYLLPSITGALIGGPVAQGNPFSFFVYIGLAGTALMLVVITILTAGGGGEEA